jgi:hypothetical protein
MTHYLIAAAVRIQPWLARTPELQLIRGASRALSEVTSDDTVGGVLAKGHCAAVVCSEAGDIDGVVAVRAAAAADVAAAGDLVENHLRRSLPGLEWAVWSGEAASYLDAYQASKVPGRLLVPSLLSVPFAAACTGCGAEMGLRPAASRSAAGVAGDRLGPDCLRRKESGTSARSDPYAQAKGLEGITPRTFEELALAVGNPGRRADSYGGKLNHLAVIAADGNGIGALFALLAERGDPTERAHAAQALKTATQSAVAAAVAAISTGGPDEIRPAILHYLGGDDILISVPAPLAWAFVVELAHQFRICMRVEHLGADPGVRDLVDSASLGIGMVIAHRSYPFAQAQVIAHRAMTHAKSAVQGRRAAVNWVDLTAESDVDPGRYFTIDDLAALEGGPSATIDPARVLDLPAAARAVLTQLITDALTAATRFAGPTRTEPGERRRLADRLGHGIDRLRNQADRTNRPELTAYLESTVDRALPALHAGDPASSVESARDVLTHLRELNRWLALSRWWPTAPPPAARPAGVS